MTIFYFHGFASSAQSTKAVVFKEYINEHFPQINIVVPDIANKIEDSFIQLKQLVKQEAGNKCFIGSSLGGFYASFFAEQFNAKAVLINPASTPYLGMEMYLGMNTNHATNEEFEITDEDLQCLKTHNVPSLKNPKNYLILHETGDEVIPSQYTFDFYQGCYFIVRSGGSHSFDSFAQHLQSITDFLQLSESK